MLCFEYGLKHYLQKNQQKTLLKTDGKDLLTKWKYPKNAYHNMIYWRLNIVEVNGQLL